MLKCPEGRTSCNVEYCHHCAYLIKESVWNKKFFSWERGVFRKPNCFYCGGKGGKRYCESVGRCFFGAVSYKKFFKRYLAKIIFKISDFMRDVITNLIRKGNPNWVYPRYRHPHSKFYEKVFKIEGWLLDREI